MLWCFWMIIFWVPTATKGILFVPCFLCLYHKPQRGSFWTSLPAYMAGIVCNHICKDLKQLKQIVFINPVTLYCFVSGQLSCLSTPALCGPAFHEGFMVLVCFLLGASYLDCTSKLDWFCAVIFAAILGRGFLLQTTRLLLDFCGAPCCCVLDLSWFLAPKISRGECCTERVKTTPCRDPKFYIVTDISAGE